MGRRKKLRLTCRPDEDHPLYALLAAHPSGGRILLDYATAWYAFSLGQQSQITDQPLAQSEETEDHGELKEDPLDDRLVDDALR